MSKGLTLTIIFEGQSLNYDEGFGNLSTLKKMRRGNGETYSFASRQSLRYSIFTQGVNDFGWKPADVEEAGKGDQKVTQPLNEESIENSEELDLFGYMKTNVKLGTKKEVTVTRIAPVRVLPAFSLEPFFSDVEMLTNKYQADKIQIQPNMANAEVHRSLYRYTITIDLDRIGNEKNKILTKVSPNKGVTKEDKEFKDFEEELRKIDLKPETKSQRICQLLDIIKTLWRDIRGRREDLKPLFIIGGVYDSKNPFFVNLINIEWENSLPKIKFSSIKQLLNSPGELVNNTFIGIRNGVFYHSTDDLQAEFKNGIVLDSPEMVIEKLKEKIKEYYWPKENNKREE